MEDGAAVPFGDFLAAKPADAVLFDVPLGTGCPALLEAVGVPHFAARALTSIDEPDTDCSDEELPTFWMDMCHKFAPEEQTEYVNLQLNPERWTGYNGSHVWRAIYEAVSYTHLTLPTKA